MFGAASKHDQVFYRGFEGHAQELRGAAGLLSSALEAGAGLPAIRDQMREVRASGERQTRDIIGELRKTWITPFDPQDIRELILGLDSVMGLIHAAVERVGAFELHDGNGEAKGAQGLATLLGRCCDGLVEVLKLMSQKKTEVQILAICGRLRSLQEEAGESYRQAIVGLFVHTQDVREVMKWHEVLDKIEAATAHCGRVAQEIEAIVAGLA
jgi:uncharacterized protein Yka (UPF0111/DUF47 family)